MRNRLQQVLLSTTYANITPILSLSSSLHPEEEEAVKAHTHTHVDQVILRLSQLFYEQGVGLKSKRFNPAGVYQLPITRLRTHAHLSQLLPITGNHFMIKFQEIRRSEEHTS